MFNKVTYLVLVLFLSNTVGYSQNCAPLTLDSISNPGIYTTASYLESSGMRNGPDYAGATVYYPTNATPPFASIVIVPGFVSAQSTIQTWGPFLASHGIVTVTIGTNSLFDDPIARKDALLDAIVSISRENTRTSSPLNGDLDTTKMAVAGWSMGGGGAQLAAVADTTIKAVVALCPWLSTATTNAAALTHPVPVLIFSGELDGVAPPALHADVHYGFTPRTTNKLLFEVDNAGHNVANNPIGGQGFVGKIALSWLKQYLVGDSCYCPLVLNAPSTSSKYLTNVSCPVTATSLNKVEKASNLSFKMYPNPSKGKIQLEVENLGAQTTYEIISLNGVKISQDRIQDRITTINLNNFPSGMYLLNLMTPKSSERIRFIVL
jgi:dienelactone hydrolase